MRYMRPPLIQKEMAHRIYDVLVEECGADNAERDWFVELVGQVRSTNFLFRSRLKFGRFWHVGGKMYVASDSMRRPESDDKMMKAANTRLAELKDEMNGRSQSIS